MGPSYYNITVQCWYILLFLCRSPKVSFNFHLVSNLPLRLFSSCSCGKTHCFLNRPLEESWQKNTAEKIIATLTNKV